MFYLLGFVVASAAFILLIGLAGRGPRPADLRPGQGRKPSPARPRRTAVDEVFEAEV